jgi:hypothetical protein
MEMRYFWLLDREAQKTSSSSTPQVKKIWQTIQQNIIQQKYIDMSDPTICNKPTHLSSSYALQDLVLGEGVLKHWQMGI